MSQDLKLTDIATSGTVTSVVIILLLGRTWLLPSYVHILGGLRQDFLRGVGKPTSRHFKIHGQQRNQGQQITVGQQRRTEKTTTTRRTGRQEAHRTGEEYGKEGKKGEWGG